jgi:NTE family protein
MKTTRRSNRKGAQVTINHLKNKKVGLALGSGSARGWAHIGVIQALSEAGVPINYVAGTSMGALVGSFYASGHLPALREFALEMDWKQVVYFFDVVFPRSGLIDGIKVQNFIRDHVGTVNIEDLDTPFSTVATDLTKGTEVVIGSGDIIEAVRASISVPGIFTPVQQNDMYLVDGGLVNPVPVTAVRAMGADYIIAVDLNHDIMEKKGTIKTGVHEKKMKASAPNENTKNRIWTLLDEKMKRLDIPFSEHIEKWISTKEHAPNIFEILISSINVMEARITEARLTLDQPDLLIKPSLGHIKLMEFHKADEAITGGHEAAVALLKETFQD